MRRHFTGYFPMGLLAYFKFIFFDLTIVNGFQRNDTNYH